MSFDQYVGHGWLLCPIREGEKQPRGKGWNTRERAVTSAERARYLSGAGLLHAFSGTCAIDIDELDLTRHWLAARGIDIDEYLSAPDAVQIVSGDRTRGKLIYALPEPLPTKQIKNEDKSLMLFEFRCGATTGNSAQDVLPPTVNPRTRKQYQWIGDWRNLPPLPGPLLALWKSLVTPATPDRATPAPESRGAAYGDLRRLLPSFDPDMTYDEWLKVGMALHHETGGSGDGLALWDEWSAQGTKYKGVEDLEPHWLSFQLDVTHPVTLGSLLREQVASVDDFDVIDDEDVDLFSEALQAQHEERVAQFVFTPLHELANRPPPSWIVDELLPREDLSMLVGASGAGKSFLALYMALAIARGLPFAGHDTEQGTVCWIAAEAEGSMRNRYRAYAQTEEIELDSVQNFYVVGAGVSLSDSAGVDALAEAAAQHEPSLVVVDTLAAASGGVNENSGEDMAVVLDSCRAIHRATGATVLLIHHTGKEKEKGARGWSGLKAAMHAELWVEQQDDSELRELTVTKMRDGPEGEVIPFRLAPVNIGLDDRDRVIQSAAVELVDPATLEDRGEPSERLPENKEQAEALLVIRSIMPLSGAPVTCQEVYTALAERMAAPEAGVRDKRETKAKALLDKLALWNWLSIRNGLVYSVEDGAEQDMVEDLL